MDRFEDDLRRTMRTDVDRVDPDALLAEVRTGVRRRRRRRAVAAGLATAAVVAVVAGVVGTALPRRESGAPPVAGRSGTGQPVVAGTAVSVSASRPDRFWVLGSRPCDGGRCAQVTADRAQTPLPVPAIPVPSDVNDTPPAAVTEVRRAVDGTDGWLFGGALWSTHDGGRTWAEQHLMDGTTVSSVASYGDRVLALATDGQGLVLFESPTSSDGWTPLHLPAGLSTPTSPLVLAHGVWSFVAWDPGLGATVVVSTADRARSWAETPSPCGAVDSLAGTGTSLWLTCQAEGAGAVLHSSDGLHWSTVTSAMLGEGARLAPRDGASALLYLGRRAVLVSRAGARPVDVPLPGGDVVRYAGFNDPRHGFLVTSGGDLLLSDDGGATWGPLG